MRANWRARLIGGILTGLCGLALCACAAGSRAPRAEAVSNAVALAQSHETFRKAIEASPADPAPFAAYCRFIPAVIDRQVSEWRGLIDMEKDAVKIPSFLKLLADTSSDIDTHNTWLTNHCQCERIEFNDALVHFREYAKGNRNLIRNTQELAAQRMNELKARSAQLSEEGRRYLLEKRIEEAAAAAAQALEYNSENAQARAIRDLSLRFEAAREAFLGGHLQSAKTKFDSLSKVVAFNEQAEPYQIEIRLRQARINQALARAEALLKKKRVAEAAMTIVEVAEVDLDRKEELKKRAAAVATLNNFLDAESRRDLVAAKAFATEALASWPDCATLKEWDLRVTTELSLLEARKALDAAGILAAAGRIEEVVAELEKPAKLAPKQKAILARADKMRAQLKKEQTILAQKSVKNGDELAAWRAFRACGLLGRDKMCVERQAALGTSLNLRYLARAEELAKAGDWVRELMARGLARQVRPDARADSDPKLDGLLAALPQRLALAISAQGGLGQAACGEADVAAARESLTAQARAQGLDLDWQSTATEKIVWRLLLAHTPRPTLQELKSWLEAGALPVSPPPPPAAKGQKDAPPPAPVELGRLWVLMDNENAMQASLWQKDATEPDAAILLAPLLSSQKMLRGAETPEGALRRAFADGKAPADWLPFAPLLAP